MKSKKPGFDPRIDAYVAKAPAFAQPVLEYIRDSVHAACPLVEETMKWSRPHFEYKGVMCGMSAFKAHCSFGFWKGSLILPNRDNKEGEAAGQFGRITSVKDLPSKKTIAGYVKAAMKLNEAGVKSPMMANRTTRAALSVPADLIAALKKNKLAKITFDDFSPSNQREYVAWIIEAKSEETRTRRLLTAIEWMAEGKIRNWKHVKK